MMHCISIFLYKEEEFRVFVFALAMNMTFFTCQTVLAVFLDCFKIIIFLVFSSFFAFFFLLLFSAFFAVTGFIFRQMGRKKSSTENVNVLIFSCINSLNNKKQSYS